jgi:hypothetical protein
MLVLAFLCLRLRLWLREVVPREHAAPDQQEYDDAHDRKPEVRRLVRRYDLPIGIIETVPHDLFAHRNFLLSVSVLKQARPGSTAPALHSLV